MSTHAGPNTGFSTPVDYFGVTGGVECISSNSGTSGNVAEAQQADGSVCAYDTYGEKMSPSCEYLITGTISGLPALGEVVTCGTGTDAKKIVVTNIAITTAAGDYPKLSISGEEVQSDATSGTTWTVPVSGVSNAPKAQNVGGAFSSLPDTAPVTSLSATYSCEVTTATAPDGSNSSEVVAFAVSKGKCEVSASMTLWGGETEPTLATGWLQQSASESGANEAYNTKELTLVKYLESDSNAS